MKIVPKPEGYELRDRRSTKTNACSDWSAQDCLHSVSKEIGESEVDGLMVLWRVKEDKDGEFIYRSRCSSAEGVGPLLLIESLGQRMGWRK